MADGNNSADYAFTLPNYFPAPGQVLQSAIAQRERQLANEAEAAERKRQYDLRQQEKDEAEAFRKMQYLQEYTDPSKYQTGIDAADALTKDSLNNIYNKYRNLKLDPVTLADALRGEVGDLVGATTAMKNEAKAFEQMLPAVKNQFKSVNTDLLRQNFKGDLINRYVKGTGFNKAPESSQILENLANPEYLADYTNDISTIVDVLKSKKEGERKFAFVGKSDQDVKKYGANIGFWEQPNVDITKGFLPPGTVPTVAPKSEQRTISGVSAPVSAVPDDVFMVFAKSPSSQAEIISATKKRFNGTTLPAYNKLSDEDKANAQKSTLYDIITKVDQTGFNLEGVQTPNVTKVSMGGSGTPSKTVDYDYIKKIESSIKNNDAQSLLSYVDNLAGMRGGKLIYQSAIPLKKADGSIGGVEFTLKDEYDEPVKRVIKSDASNLRAQLVGLYQDIAGSSTKAEKSLAGEKPKPAPEPATPSKDNMISISLDGKVGAIPEKNWEAFKKKYPNAKRQ
jgi:hypothetical protein